MSAKQLGLYVPQGDEFEIPLRHYTQIDNTGGQGYRECFLTSCCMVADYLLKWKITDLANHAGMAEPEDFYASILAKYGVTTDANAQLKALDELNIKGYFSTTASIADVVHSLYLGIPVVLGTAYKGSGHMVVAKGRTKSGLTIMCPNGIRNGSTNQWITRFYSEAQAAEDEYSWGLLKRVFTDLGDEAGWALFVTEVEGIKTGVKAGM